MELPDESVKLGMKEEEIMYTLLREDMRDLQEDGFDGSEEETKIFEGVFCNNGEESLPESENPADSSRAVQCRIVESLEDGDLCSYSIRCTFPCPRPVPQESAGKLLVPTITSEIEADAANQTKEAAQDKSPVIPIPTAFPLSQMEPDTEYQANQKVVNEDSTLPAPMSSPISEVELNNLGQTQQGELISQDKSAPLVSEIKSDTMIQRDKRELVPHDQSTSPLADTSISSSVEINVVNETCIGEAAPQGMGGIVHESLPTTPPSSQVDQRDEPGTSVFSGALDISKIEDPSVTNLCNHLRAHANRLLKECGYKVKLRAKKGNPDRFHYLYQQPSGGSAVSYLPKTWVSLGKLFQSSLTRSALDKTHLLGRQWLNVNEFSSDLLKTLTYVEKMLQDSDCGLTLSDQWFLLDPFIAVAWIDRKITALKKDVPVKALQSSTSVLVDNEKMVMQRNAMNPLIYSRRRCKKSLLPLLVSGTDQEMKMDGTNMLMVEGDQVVLGEGVMSGEKDVIKPIVAEEDVPTASFLHKGPCTNERDVHSASNLHASPVITGEGMPCTADFQVTPTILGEKVSITTGEQMQGAAQVHASQGTNGEEALHIAEASAASAPAGEKLHVSEVTVGEEESIKKHPSEIPVTVPANLPDRGVDKKYQCTSQSSINLTSEQAPINAVHPVARYDNIPVGTKFMINEVSRNEVLQRPVLVLYPSGVPFPSDIIYSHSQSITSGVDPPIYQASLFQGTLSFDANNGLQIEEHSITWAMCNPLESKSKRKHKSTFGTKENRPHKRSKKTKEKSGSVTRHETHERKRPGRKRVCQFHEHDLLISAIITKKSLKCKKYHRKTPKETHIHPKNFTDKIVKPSQNTTNNKKNSTQGARTVLMLLINTGKVSVNGKIQYKNSKGNKVKEGKLTRNGVLCQCCGATFTISGFQNHSSGESGNQGMNLFLGSGKPYVMCLLESWSMEYKERRRGMRVRDVDIDSNNDLCGLCGDGGELVCCDSCPSSFHELCLLSQKIPEDCWHCPSCSCGSCEQMISKQSVFFSSINYLQCSQCDRRFHVKCMRDTNGIENESPPVSWFCGNQCEQIYSYLQSQTGLVNDIGDGFSFSILRYNHGQTKNLKLGKLVQLAENNMKLALALKITEECFFPILDPRTGIDLIPLVLYNWRVDALRLDYKGFYTAVLEKDERIISVASIRLRGAMVAEMPLVATTPENREQGMCRRLISAIEEMLKLLKVKMLMLCAIPSLVDTWISHFGFVHIQDGDKEIFSKLSLLYIPGTYILKKDLSALSVEPQGDDCHHASAGIEFNGAEGEKTSVMVE